MKVLITECGDFNCACGNNPNAEGAYACTKEGEYVDPTPELWPEPWFKCDRCGTVFDVNTGEIK